MGTDNPRGQDGRGNHRAVFRAMPQGLEIREAEDGTPTLSGTLAVFDQFTEINSRMEGHFMERIAPGAFDKTIQENRDRMRVLFNHGKDPSIGEKPLGPIRELWTDEDGVRCEVPLLDTSYNHDIAEMASSDPPVLGMSFRFEVLREDFDRKPSRSQHNPKGLPERTVQEVRMSEFGPVTFPAYSGTKVGLRSITDRMADNVVFDEAFNRGRYVDKAELVSSVRAELAKIGSRHNTESSVTIETPFSVDVGSREELDADVTQMLEDRVDAEDMGAIAMMIQAGAEYLAEQDETDDQANIPRMEAILASLADLMQVEAQETEPAEPEEDSAVLDGETRGVEEADATDTAPPEDRAAEEHPAEGRRDSEPQTAEKRKVDDMTIDEVRGRRAEIKERFKQIAAETGAESFTADTRGEWDSLTAELEEVDANIRDYDERQEMLRKLVDKDDHLEPEKNRKLDRTAYGNRVASRVPDNIYAVEEYRNLSNNDDDHRQALKDGAMKAIERAHFPHPDANREDEQGNIEKLLRTIDGDATFAQRVLRTDDPVYRRAFWKTMAGRSVSREEQEALGRVQERALGIGTQGGTYPVPVTLDPTVIRTSNQVINPIRGLARVEQITGDLWYGVASAGITASYGAEASEAGDGSPTLTQPSAQVEKAKTFVPFSIEVGEDWGRLESEMSGMFQDAKDVLESTKFLAGLGHASTEPQGLLVGGTIAVSTAAATVFAVQDLYSLEQSLPPRWIPNASFVANRMYLNKIRQFDTAGGASLWVQLGDGIPPRLLDYPTQQWSDMSTGTISGSSIMTFGDFKQYLIVDRIGANVELIPHLFGTVNNYPTGQRGLFMYWRNTATVLTALAFRTLKLT